MTTDLRCPNCGSADCIMDSIRRSGRFEAFCSVCYCAGPDCPTAAEARAAFLMPAARADERRNVLEWMKANGFQFVSNDRDTLGDIMEKYPIKGKPDE